jgi:two-component system nitrogen regulation response regulator NtrX
MFPTILIVDDEPSIVQSLSGLLTDEGFSVLSASNGYEALKVIETESPDLVLLDIWMPGIDGIETLKEIKKDNPFIQVIIITGHGTIETAVKATKLGAFDFIEKPLSIDKVIVGINNALNFRRLEEENRYLRKKTLEKHSINGNSAPILELKQKILNAAPTEAWILVTGENGVGKELVARTIHQYSARAEQPMIAINCAMLPDEVLESELFGHEKDVDKGVSHRKRGKFEIANKGTVFLDEIGDMSMPTQAKLLRAIQEQQFHRVGGGREISADIRIIASSNKDLEEEIKQGRFREDLYFRLNVVPIEVPPLRVRKEDIPLLVETFIKECESSNIGRKKQMDPAAVALLKEYSWPGNVRELKNLVERLVIMIVSDVIKKEDIPPPYNPGKASRENEIETKLMQMDQLSIARTAFEKEFVRRKLIEYDHDLQQTAQAIGLGTQALAQKLKKLQLTD